MPGISFDAISTLVGDIYDAATDDGQWHNVVGNMSDLFGCSRVCLTGMEEYRFEAFSTVEDEDFVSEGSLLAHLRDPLMSAAFSVPTGVAYSRRQIIDEHEFRRRELWSDWYRHRDLDQGLGCILHMSDGRNWSIHAHRGRGQREFDDDELKVFQHLSDHMLRACRIGRRMRQAITYADMFTRLPIGLLLLDGRGRATTINGEADRLVTLKGSPLSVRNSQLVCSDRSAGPDFMARLFALASGQLQGDLNAVLSCADRDFGADGTTIVVSATRFSGSSPVGASAQGSVMIVLRDVALTGSGAFIKHLQELFALTPAEANLCFSLASGLSLKEAALRADITFKTARTYLERIFAKTGTRQQSQLVGLIKTTRPLF